MSIVSRKFYSRDATTVARELLGKILIRQLDGKTIKGRIIETESYLGVDDPASHAFVGRTKRTEVIFGEAGHAYVHSIHRYFCMDIVAEKKDIAGSVLIRALLPIVAIDTKVDGPGKLCRSLGITKEQNGVDVTNTKSGLYVIDDGFIVKQSEIIVSPRVGITKARDKLLRFRLKLG